MKIAHLADLHIGRNLHGFSLIDDQVYILDQIVSRIRQLGVSAVIIAGDIYDKPAPPAEAVKVFDKFLTELADGRISVFIISGNHDSPERLGFAGRIMQDRKVYICSVFQGQAEKVTLKDEFGPINFYMLPFIKPAHAGRFYEDSRFETYNDALQAVCGSVRLNKEERNIIALHQFVTYPGTLPELSDSENISAGGLENVSAGLFEEYDYAALGHLHRAQPAGFEHVRYSGSPLKYSFSECSHKKSFTVAEFREKGSAEIYTEELYPLRDMRKIKGPIDMLLSEETASEGSRDDFIHITLTDEDEPADAMGRIRRVYINAMQLEYDNKRTQSRNVPDEAADIKKHSPGKLFEIFYEELNGAVMNSVQKEIAVKLMEEAEEGL